MDKILKDKKIQIIKIKSFLEKYAKLSEENYDITKIPFFSKSNDSKDFYIGYKTIKEKIPKGLNRNIKLLYDIVGHPNKEIYIGEWTILSLEKCMENYTHYCNDGQKNVFDVALRYMGMGHVEVISCDLNTHLLFYRRDGGSNGWDREFNYKKLLNYNPNEYNQFFFSDWFYNITTKNQYTTHDL